MTNAIRIIFKTDTTVIWSICKDWESLFNLYFLYIPVQPAWLRHKVGKGLRLSIWERSDLYPKYWSWSPWSHHHCHLWQVVPSRRLQWSTFVSFSPSGMYLKLISGSGLSPAEVWRDLFRIQKLFLYSGLIVGIKKGAMIWWLSQLILFWTQMLINSKVIFSSIVKCWTSIHLRHEARKLLLLQNPCKTLSTMSTWKFEVVWTAPEVLWGNEEGDGEHLPGGHPANHAHNPDPLGLQDACEEHVELVGTFLPAIFQSCLFWISLGPLIPL